VSDKYNGWTNRETWLIGLWWGDFVDDTAEQCADMAEFIAVMKECVDEANPLGHESNMFADMMSGALARVDWYDIAKHYTEYWTVEEDDDEEDI